MRQPATPKPIIESAATLRLRQLRRRESDREFWRQSKRLRALVKAQKLS